MFVINPEPLKEFNNPLLAFFPKKVILNSSDNFYGIYEASCRVGCLQNPSRISF